jgi:transcriptional regulator with XRE-family HTH domain
MDTDKDRWHRTQFANRLNFLCRERPIQSETIARHLRLHRTTLWKWRTEPRYMPGQYETLIAIADLFGVSTDWLLGRTDRVERLPDAVEALAAMATEAEHKADDIEEEREADDIDARIKLLTAARRAKDARGDLTSLTADEMAGAIAQTAPCSGERPVPTARDGALPSPAARGRTRQGAAS